MPAFENILKTEYEYTSKKFDEAIQYNEHHPDNTDYIYWKGRLEEVKSLMNKI